MLGRQGRFGGVAVPAAADPPAIESVGAEYCYRGPATKKRSLSNTCASKTSKAAAK